MDYRKRKSTAEVTEAIERAVLSYLEDFNGEPVSMLQVFNYASQFGGDEPVSLNFFNTILGGMRSMGAITIDRNHKAIAVTPAGLQSLRRFDRTPNDVRPTEGEGNGGAA